MKVYVDFFGTELLAVVWGHISKSPFSFFCSTNDVSGLKGAGETAHWSTRSCLSSLSLGMFLSDFGMSVCGERPVLRQLGLLNSLLADTRW